MSGGFVNGVQSPAVSFSMNTAVTSAGILLKKNATSGEMELCGAGERADGYSVKSTENLAGTAVADVQCGVLPIITGNVAELVLTAANIEVNIGDLLDTAALGTVDGEAAGTTHIGVALEHKAALAGGAAATKFIKVLLNQYTHF
jgi:hypothetical protein